MCKPACYGYWLMASSIGSGGYAPVKVDVRIIAATHQNLELRVQEGKFREDLFHRLNVIRVHLPPLRERSEDIPRLARYFFTRSG